MQAELGRDHGVPRARSGIAAVAVFVVGIAVGGVLALGTLAFSAADTLRASWWLVVAVPLGCVALAPPVLQRLGDLHCGSRAARAASTGSHQRRWYRLRRGRWSPGSASAPAPGSSPLWSPRRFRGSGCSAWGLHDCVDRRLPCRGRAGRGRRARAHARARARRRDVALRRVRGGTRRPGALADQRRPGGGRRARRGWTPRTGSSREVPQSRHVDVTGGRLGHPIRVIGAVVDVELAVLAGAVPHQPVRQPHYGDRRDVTLFQSRLWCNDEPADGGRGDEPAPSGGQPTASEPFSHTDYEYSSPPAEPSPATDEAIPTAAYSRTRR